MRGNVYAFTYLTKEQRQDYLDRWDEVSVEDGNGGPKVLILDVEPSVSLTGRMCLTNLDLRLRPLPSNDQLPNALSDDEWEQYKKALFKQQDDNDD